MDKAQPWAHGFVLLTVAILALISIVLQAAELATVLRYERTELLAEIWRLWTGHLVHLSWAHLGMNLLTVAVLQALFIGVWRAVDWLLLLSVLGLAVSLLFWGLQPQLEWYVGLSGVLHGMWAVGAMRLWQRDQLVAGLLIVLLIAKIVYEQVAGSMPWSQSLAGGKVVIDAHAYGAYVGTAWAAFELFCKAFGKTTNND